ncbi:MAG: hypothetical protein ACR2KN_04895 [Geodermatophilaceae bacterium]
MNSSSIDDAGDGLVVGATGAVVGATGVLMPVPVVAGRSGTIVLVAGGGAPVAVQEVSKNAVATAASERLTG